MHTHTYSPCLDMQSPAKTIFIALSVTSIHIGITHFCTETNKPSLSSSSSRTNRVAAELCQLQGAQILFVAFSSGVYLIFVHIMLTPDWKDRSWFFRLWITLTARVSKPKWLGWCLFNVTSCHTLSCRCDRVSDAILALLAQSEVYLGFDKIKAGSFLVAFIWNQLYLTK